MRRTKSGAIHAHSKSIQQQGFVTRNPCEALLTESKHLLLMLDIFAPQLPQGGESVEIVTMRAAARKLIEFLERNR